jgi:hypothetical protein
LLLQRSILPQPTGSYLLRLRLSQFDDSQVRARVLASRLRYRLRKLRSGFLISDIECTVPLPVSNVTFAVSPPDIA